VRAPSIQSIPATSRFNTRLHSRLGRLARLCYGVVAVIGVVTLWGWVLGVARLRDLGAEFSPMPPGASLAFLLLACSYFAPTRRLAWSAAGVAAAATLLSFFPASGFIPETLALVPAIAMLLLAAATPMQDEVRVLGVPLNSAAAVLVGGVAFFALLGLSLRLLRLDIAAPLLGFSLPGAAATLLAAGALAAGTPSAWLLETLSGRGTGAVVTRALLPAAFGVPLAIGWMRLLAEREGLFSEAFGMALFTLVMIGSFSALVVWVARTLDRSAAQRVHAEEQAGEQREWLHVTLAAIGDGVIATDAAGHVRFLNAAAQRLTGWRAAEAAGQICCADFLYLFDERTGAALECPLTQTLRTRSPTTVPGEPALRARDGTVHAVDVNAAPILDPSGGQEAVHGAVLVLREASARRRAERAMREAYTELDQRVVRRTAALERASTALRERNALLNAITTGTPDLICAKDRQGQLLMANPAWTEVASLGKGGSATGLDDTDRLVLECGETMTIEQSMGDERTFLTTKSPLRDEQGRTIGLIGVATDITQRKQAQRELEKLVIAEQRLRAEAERANRAKDEFLAIVSHELRSPLNALRGWAHLMASTRPLDLALMDRAAKAIKRNVDHQTRLIDDLLDTSRIVSGKLNIDRRAVNLVEVVLAALEASRPGSAAKSIDLRFTPVDAAIMVMGDGGRLQQLVSNLLSNAVKFTPEHGAIEVRLLKNGERVQLLVRDNGIGIAPEFLPHVFDRFTQADTSAGRRAGGLGIGLALVRHIALLHGGQVRADSAGAGKGATFTVELPAVAQPVLPPAARPERRSLAGALRGVRIWMVDDDLDAHEVVALTLQQTGAAVESFASCAELTAALEGRLPSRAPDLFLIDLAMPGEDGFETLRRIRSLETAAGAGPVPAIALTAFTQIERERLLAAGFSERVDKPVDVEKLVATIRTLLSEMLIAAKRA
jgi:PAS domain S-box-containing protein